MSKYLLEIGTEELPYQFIPVAEKQLQESFKKLFDNNGIKYSLAKSYSTPRRLTVVFEGLDEKQADISKEVKGPIVSVALDANNNFTNAAIGFAKKNGIETKDLIIKDNYIWANIEQKGKTTAEFIQENVANIVLSMQGPYFMRWSNLDVKFQRPIRWIVSLMNGEELPVEIAGVKSSKYSRGHRFTSDKVEIKNSDTYADDLYKANVIVDSQKRRDVIAKLAGEKAKEIGCEAVLNENLLDEVTCLTEWPVPVLCDFDEKYLDIPEKVVVTVMATHQRYFPVYKNGKLTNHFITMANYVGSEFENIKAGNLRVIKARLDDAIFFFKEDTKKPLADYIENLKGITFQKGMGSVYDKTQRIIELSKFLADKLNISFKTIERTAQLCKADLATSLVFEFTELQGFIGSDYALHAGEEPAVANGIKEHYFPLNASSEPAEAIEGQIVGIADKIDTVVAVFADGKKPTGSNDPLGVRRNVLGILKTIIIRDLNVDLMALIKKSIDILPIQIEDKTKLLESIVDFFEQRLVIYYSDKFAQDVLQACVSGKNVLSNLKDFTERAEILTELKKQPKYADLHEGANRIIRIIKDTKFNNQTVDNGLFVNDYEKNLYAKTVEIADNLSYKEIIEKLLNITPEITAFFDNVLVMDNDEKIKQNRINLLINLREKFSRIADFSKVLAD